MKRYKHSKLFASNSGFTRVELIFVIFVAVLLAGCGPSAPDISIHDAAYEGNINTINRHWAAGIDVNVPGENGWTALHEAASNNHKEVVELLITIGADVNAQGDNGETPLHEAARNNHKEISELLIAKSADVNAKNSDGATPLDVAILWNEKETADLLRKHGGKAKTPDITIHKAAGKGNIEAVKQHLAEGANVNAKDDNGSTPLDWADGETADLLRKHGGKTSAWLNADDSIHTAILAGHIEAVKQHLDAGTDVNAKDVEGETPLHETAIYDHKEIAELLIAKGADVNAKDKRGFTPLDRAEIQGQSEIADLLRKHGGITAAMPATAAQLQDIYAGLRDPAPNTRSDAKYNRGEAVKESMQEWLNDYYKKYPKPRVLEVSVVSRGLLSNTHEGIAKVQHNGKVHNVLVTVTADWERGIWEARPGSFLFLTQ